MKCTKCGGDLGENQKFCKYCGTPVEQVTGSEESAGQTSWCRNCGATLKSGNAFCTQCGSSVLDADVTAFVIEEKRLNGGLAGKLGNVVFIMIIFAFAVFAGYYFAEKYGVFDQNAEEFAALGANEEIVLEGSELRETAADGETDYDLENTSEYDQWENDTLAESEKFLLAREDTFANGIDVQEYILVGSDSRYLLKSELQGLTAEECRLARNEIYARHGRRFDDEYLQTYFGSKEWYTPVINPDEFKESSLNVYEIANRDLIVEYEKECGYR